MKQRKPSLTLAPEHTRRGFLLEGLKAATGLGSVTFLSGQSELVKAKDTSRDDFHLQSALGVARWLQACKVDAGTGTAWPADPTKPQSVSPELYSGTAGVVLFFLEVNHFIPNAKFLKDAQGGADYLVSTLAGARAGLDAGFYTGLAGIGYCLDKTSEVSGIDRHRAAAQQCLQLINDRARPVGAGVDWNGSTDIISGNAGIGLYLLHVARERNDVASLELAAKAGKRLIELGIPELGGLKWKMMPSFERLMPNFSHGTAGVCYFLATLYQATKDKTFLDTALAGAKYLQAVANTEGECCRIFHHEPGGKDLYYLGWCHGSTGTARLFYRLYQATGDRLWMDWVHNCARAILQSGIPEKQTPGFWNNAGQCCGLAGVADFFLSLYRITKEQQYLKFCERVAAHLLSRATAEHGGLKWVQAENRIRPNEVAAQTGYMQGAAGIGMLFLRLYAFRGGKHTFITLPDSPYEKSGTR